jgi:hypothetical protein
MGGVTINVQMPVTDDRFPVDRQQPAPDLHPERIQHMTGAAALQYARSRHGSNDFDRGHPPAARAAVAARAGRPAGADPATAGPRPGAQKTVKTDIPVDSSRRCSAGVRGRHEGHPL